MNITSTTAQQIIDKAEARARETGEPVKAKIPAPQLVQYDNDDNILWREFDAITTAERLDGFDAFHKHHYDANEEEWWGEFDGHVYFTIEADTTWSGQRIVDTIDALEYGCITHDMYPEDDTDDTERSSMRVVYRLFDDCEDI